MYKILATQEVPGRSNQELINLALNVLNNKNIRVFTIEEQTIIAENTVFFKEKDSKLVLICKDEKIELSTTDTIEISFPDRSHIKKCNEIAKEISNFLSSSSEIENVCRQEFLELANGKLISKEIFENDKRMNEKFRKMKELSFSSKPFTWISMSISITTFLILLLLGGNLFNNNPQFLFEMGGNIKNATLDGGWWRLITSTILHVDILHLGMNMYILFLIGSLLETFLGTKKVTVAYILSGLLASLTSTWWSSSNDVSVGASGAVFGLLGVVSFYALRKDEDLSLIKHKELLFVVIIVQLGLSFQNGIDVAAHFGGFIAGIIIALVYYLFRDEKFKEKINIVITASCFSTIIFIIIALNNIRPFIDSSYYLVELKKLEYGLHTFCARSGIDTLTKIKRSLIVYRSFDSLTNIAKEINKGEIKEEYLDDLSKYSKLKTRYYNMMKSQSEGNFVNKSELNQILKQIAQINQKYEHMKNKTKHKKGANIAPFIFNFLLFN